jgi:hypothetical protein
VSVNETGESMTIKVTITNSDPRETAVIVASEYYCSTAPRQYDETHPRPVRMHQLKGGESVELWVHSTQAISVFEVSQ